MIPKPTPEGDGLQARLACRLAKAAVEDCCTTHVPEDGSGVWIMLTRRYGSPGAQRDLSEELEYLDQCGMLQRHPKSENLVRILDAAQTPAPMVADTDGLLREAFWLLTQFSSMYVEPESIHGSRTHSWLTRYAESRLGRSFAAAAPGSATADAPAPVGVYGEPWNWSEDGGVCALLKHSGGMVALLAGDDSLNVDSMTARRIVACVNTCVRESTEDLEADLRAGAVSR